MSAIKKGIKKIGDWVSDNWKEILVAAAVVFTAGIATVGIGAYSAAVGSQGLWAATGSTMWAGATSVAGTFGIGGGASGSVAASAGMEGATLLTGAGAQAAGLASTGSGAGAGLMGPAAQAGQASSAVGAYTGPGSSFMGGGGSVFGGSANPSVTAGPQATGMQAGSQAAQGAQGAQAAQGAQSAGLMQQGAQQGGGMFSKGSLGGDMLRSAAPTLMYTAGNYLAARGQEEAGKPKALWGVDMESGEAMQPGNLPQQQGQQQQPQPGQRFRGPDGKEYEIGQDGQPRLVEQRGRVSAPPLAPWMRSQQAPSVNNPIWQQPGTQRYRGGV